VLCFLSDSSQNTARNNLLFDKLFCQITFGDVLRFADITSENRNKWFQIKIADTLLSVV
jgi:hypothetical protein